MMKKNRVEKTFAVSLGLHLLMLLAVSIHFPRVKTPEKIEIAFLQPEKKKEPMLSRKAPKASLKMASQEIKKADDHEPNDAKFLSEHNQSVEKQTRARSTGKFKNSKTVGQIAESHENLKTLSDAEIAMRQALSKRPKISASPQAPKEVTSPDEEESATDDHIIADEGAETLINTREFKYYAYCKRIKDKIQVLWEPKIKAKVRNLDGGRSIASVSQEKVTKTIIVLDSEGVLERVQVIGASGLEDLDESAIEAFRAASPFPNPPKGIIDPDGKIRIRWDFVLSEN